MTNFVKIKPKIPNYSDSQKPCIVPMLETGNHFLSLIMVHLSQTELILPVPVFILEDDAIMQQRLKRILLEIGYAEDALILPRPYLRQ